MGHYNRCGSVVCPFNSSRAELSSGGDTEGSGGAEADQDDRQEEYRKIVESPGAALIVDVREPQDYASGHVPGAINIPRGVLEFQIWKQVGFPASTEMDRPLYLQCQNGNRASLAAQSLEVMSLEDWQKTGNPFVK